MQDRKVTITIDEDGKTEIEVDGVKGAACTELTAELETALGVPLSRKEKSDMHAVKAKTGAHQTLKGQ